MKREKGIGIIYLIALIAILVILAGFLGPYLFVRETQRQKDVETLEKIKAIKTAIIGEPEIISHRLRSKFGYVGDMGGLPPILEYLVLQQNPTPNPFPLSWNQTGWTIHSSTGIGYGWRGPYLDTSQDGNWNFYCFRDAWGTKFQYVDNAGNNIINPLSVSFPVYIRSAGPDRVFGTSDDINENNHPEICRILEDEVRAYLRGYTYCASAPSSEQLPVRRSNIYVFYPTFYITGAVTLVEDGPYTSSSTGTCPYDQTPPPTCYYFETPSKIPVGIRKVIIEPSNPIVDEFVLVNGGGTLHDGSAGRMRWNLRGGSCGGCITYVAGTRVNLRDTNGDCSGNSRDVFSIQIRNNCSYPVTISSIRVDYTPSLYYLNAYISTSMRTFSAVGWAYDCGGAPPPGGSSGITYFFNTNSGVVFQWGVNFYIFPLSCSPSSSVILPAGGTRYLTIGRFITSYGLCGDIRSTSFTITLSDGSVLIVP